MLFNHTPEIMICVLLQREFGLPEIKHAVVLKQRANEMYSRGTTEYGCPAFKLNVQD